MAKKEKKGKKGKREKEALLGSLMVPLSLPTDLVPALPKLPVWKEGWDLQFKLKWLEAWIASIKFFSKEVLEVPYD